MMSKMTTFQSNLMKALITLFILTISLFSIGQNGENLFTAKCNTCHILGKKSTGPDLIGVKQKWIDAGEGDLLYDWVKNSEEVIKSGQSKQAKEIEAFSPTVMTPQDVSNEDIDAIFEYIDNWVPPVAEDQSVTSTESNKAIVIVPNYGKNLNIFYFLIILMIIQIIAILVMSTSIKSLLKFKSNKKSKDLNINPIIIALFSFGLLAGNNASALTFVSYAQDSQAPWLLVEDSDLYVLIFINLILLFLVFYIRRLFLDIAYTIRPHAADVRTPIVNWKFKRIKRNLTDAVPIEEEAEILMSHEYDGIRELDNNLPPWWVYGFYTTIIFAVVYLLNYHVIGTGDLQAAEYEKSLVEANAQVQAYLNKMAMNVDENNVTLLTDDKDLGTGKVIFDANCITCHNPNGEGNQIGPNLTDASWIYGYDIKDVFSSVKYGRPAGMPEHNSKLNPVQLQQVGSYVLNLPFAEGREPQGEIMEPDK